MKKLISIISFVLWMSASSVFAAPFNSQQLATTSLTNGNVLQTNGYINTWVSTSSLGISSSPAGSNTQIQYNNNGAFGADSNLVWTSATKCLGIGAANSGICNNGGQVGLWVGGNNPLYSSGTNVNMSNASNIVLPAGKSIDGSGNGSLTSLTLSSPLTVGNGGTGVATFGQGWLEAPGGTAAIISSTSPTVNYLTATSTAATSTFMGNLMVGQCVAADTRIRRKKRKGEGVEDVTIDELEEGDIIYTFDCKKGTFGLSTVKQVCFAGVRPVIEMKTSLGKRIKTTHEHPYFVRIGKTMKEGGWKAAGFLSVGQEIAVVGPDKNTPAWDKIVSLKLLPPEDVFDIEVNEKHTFIGNGIVAHNTAFFAQASTTRVGIGNNSPRNALDFTNSDGSIYIGTSTNDSTLNLTSEVQYNPSYTNQQTATVNISALNNQSNEGNALMSLTAAGYNTGIFKMCGSITGTPVPCLTLENTQTSLYPGFMEVDAGRSYFMGFFGQQNLVGIDTNSPNTELDVNGNITDESVKSAALLGTDANGTIIPKATSTVATNLYPSVVTGNIGGAIVGLGCDTGNTASPVTLSSTTKFITTAQADPGTVAAPYTIALNTTTLQTKVCSGATVTPNSVKYNISIILN